MDTRQITRPFQFSFSCQAMRRAISRKPTGMMHCISQIGTPPNRVAVELRSASTSSRLA